MKNKRVPKKAVTKPNMEQYPYWILAFLFIPFLYILFNTCTFDFNFDDSLYINALPVKGASFVEYLKIFQNKFVYNEYRQLSAFILGMESYFFGDKPIVFHFFNCIFYLLNGFLVYKSSSLIFTEKNKAFYLCIASIYLFHPSHVEVFASIKNQESLLSNLFGLSFLCTSLLYIDKKRSIYVLLSLLSIVAAIMCKKDSVTFFVLFIPIVYYKLHWKWTVKNNFIIAILIGISLLFFTYILPIFLNYISYGFVDTFVKVDASENYIISNPSFLNHILLACQSIFHYLKFLIIPTNYYLYYGANKIQETQILNPTVLFICILAITAFIALAKNIGNTSKKWYLALLLLIVGIAPYLNIQQNIAGMVAVRYAYIGSIGFAMLFVFLLEKTKNRFQLRINIIPITSIVLIIYLPFLYKESVQWKNIDTLLSADMPFLKNSIVANRIAAERKLSLAQTATSSSTQQQYLLSATQYCQQGLAIMEDAELYGTFSKIKGMEGKKEAAIALLQKAYILDVNKPNTIYLLANMYKNYNDFDSSVFYYKKYIALSPLEERIYTELNETQRANKDFVGALQTNTKLAKIKPKSFVPFRDNGNTYLVMGDTTNAVKSYMIAFQKGYIEPTLKAQILEYYTNRNDQKGIDAIKQIVP